MNFLITSRLWIPLALFAAFIASAFISNLLFWMLIAICILFSFLNLFYKAFRAIKTKEDIDKHGFPEAVTGFPVYTYNSDEYAQAKSLVKEFIDDEKDGDFTLSLTSSQLKALVFKDGSSMSQIPMPPTKDVELSSESIPMIGTDYEIKENHILRRRIVFPDYSNSKGYSEQHKQIKYEKSGNLVQEVHYISMEDSRDVKPNRMRRLDFDLEKSEIIEKIFSNYLEGQENDNLSSFVKKIRSIEISASKMVIRF